MNVRIELHTYLPLLAHWVFSKSKKKVRPRVFLYNGFFPDPPPKKNFQGPGSLWWSKTLRPETQPETLASYSSTHSIRRFKSIDLKIKFPWHLRDTSRSHMTHSQLQWKAHQVKSRRQGCDSLTIQTKGIWNIYDDLWWHQSIYNHP